MKRKSLVDGDTRIELIRVVRPVIFPKVNCVQIERTKRASHVARDASKPLISGDRRWPVRVFSKRNGRIGWKPQCDWLQGRLTAEPRNLDRASVKSDDSKAAEHMPTSYTGSLFPFPVLCLCHAHQDIFVLDWDPGCQHLHGILEIRIQQDRSCCMH